jgi:hypothetical protein
LCGGVETIDRRRLVAERRRADRRTRAVQPVETDRRSGRDRRVGERRIALPPLSRLVPALLVVAVSLVDLAVGQVTGVKGWSLLVIAAAYPIAAYDLAKPRWWSSHLVVVWLLVVLYVMAATAHITWMLMR